MSAELSEGAEALMAQEAAGVAAEVVWAVAEAGPRLARAQGASLSAARAMPPQPTCCAAAGIGSGGSKVGSGGGSWRKQSVAGRFEPAASSNRALVPTWDGPCNSPRSSGARRGLHVPEQLCARMGLHVPEQLCEGVRVVAPSHPIGRDWIATDAFVLASSEDVPFVLTRQVVPRQDFVMLALRKLVRSALPSPLVRAMPCGMLPPLRFARTH